MDVARRTIGRRLLGLALLVLIVSFIAVSVLIYRGTFSSAIRVTFVADHTGSQLLPGADVKVRGLVVGSVDEVISRGEGAEVHLHIQHDQAPAIPANVTAQVLPATLFGDDYVDLVWPASPADGPVYSGDVIGPDRSRAAIALEQTLDDLLPVLRAVQPQKLAATLTAVSQALAHCGPELRTLVDQLNDYVGQFNPHLPALDHDISALGAVADTYDTAAPQLITALDKLSTTSSTIVDERTNLAALFGTLTTASETTTRFLQTNQNNLIMLSASSRPTLALLARYAPEYTCLLSQVAGLVPRINQASGAGTNEIGAHVTLSLSVSRGAYQPGQDTPAFTDNRGPRCYDYSGRAPQYPPGGPIQDGSQHPAAATDSGQGTDASASTTTSAFPETITLPSAASASGSPANSAAEEQLLSGLLAPMLGVPAANLPSWSSLLVGPLYRGATVSVG